MKIMREKFLIFILVGVFACSNAASKTARHSLNSDDGLDRDEQPILAFAVDEDHDSDRNSNEDRLYASMVYSYPEETQPYNLELFLEVLLGNETADFDMDSWKLSNEEEGAGSYDLYHPLNSGFDMSNKKRSDYRELSLFIKQEHNRTSFNTSPNTTSFPRKKYASIPLIVGLSLSMILVIVLTIIFLTYMLKKTTASANYEKLVSRPAWIDIVKVSQSQTLRQDKSQLLPYSPSKPTVEMV